MGYSIDPVVTGFEVSRYSGARISVFEFCHLLAALQQQSNDPDIGLTIGQQFQPAGFNVLAYLVMASHTIGEALPLVQRFQTLVIDCAETDFQIVDDHMVFTWTPYDGAVFVERVLIDLLLSAMRTFGIWATGVNEAFPAVYFQYKKPHSTSACETIFFFFFHYGCRHNGFRIPRCWCEKPIRAGSDSLKPIIYSHAQLLLDNLHKHEAYVGRVIDALIKLLPQGYATIDRVAQTMNMSARSLQRHLNGQNTSFSQLLQSVRSQMANYFLLHTELSVNEVAARVGYRVQSSFTEAYKSWFGMTPVDARAKRDLRQIVH